MNNFEAVAALLDLLLGSFHSVCVSCYGGDESIILFRSRWPRCGHRLSW